MVATTTDILNTTKAAMDSRVAEEHLDGLVAQRMRLTHQENAREAKAEELMSINMVIALVVRIAADFRDAVLAHADERSAGLILEATETSIDQQLLSGGS